MDINDFVITERNGTIDNVEHYEFECILSNVVAKDIIKKAIDYATGKDKYFMVWSDYFPEEQSCRVYFSKNINGEIELITEMEKLLKSINSGREVVACDIEDNIL